MRNTGVCCVGDNCRFPHHELNPEHTCIQCKGILHVMCAVWVPEKEGHRCNVSCKSSSEGQKSTMVCLPTNVPPTTTTTNTSTTATVKKPCSQCGQSDYQRSSSKKCKFYKARGPRTTTTNKTTKPVTNEKDDEVEAEEKALNNEDDKNNVLDMRKTSYIYVGVEPEEKAKKRYVPIVDVSSTTFEVIDTVFRIFKKDERNRSVPVEPSAEHLISKYYPERFMVIIVNASNKYRENRLRAEPSLSQWTQKSDSVPFTLKDVYHFFAILYYMGIVRLPEKDNYWSTEPLMPVHEVCH